MKDEAADVAIKEFVGLKPNMFFWGFFCFVFLIVDSSEHKKAKVMNKNVFVTISHNKCNDALMNNNCLTPFMNKIHIKNHRITTYEIINFPLQCFDDKIYILNNKNDGLIIIT